MFRLLRQGIVILLSTAVFLISGCKHDPKGPSLVPGDLSILCLGDSITAGTHGVGDDGTLSYPGLLSDQLSGYKEKIQVVNEGQNGWTVVDVASHVAQWLTPVPPRIILLQIGTNDLEQGVSPEQTAQRLDSLITQIENLAPVTHLYVASATPVRADNHPKLALSVLEKFNSLVPEIVRDHQRRHHYLVYVDLYKRAGLTDSDFGPDGEHPNDSGYRKMADFWFHTLLKHEADEIR